MAVERSYEKELRVIGLALETKRISVFEITSLPERYLIRGVPSKSGSVEKRLLGFLRSPGNSDTQSFTLSLAKINREPSKMGKPSTSESLDSFRRTVNVLGTVGAYLDLKQAELFELKVRPISLSLWYRDKAGHEQQEDRAVSSFYNLFINLRENHPNRNNTARATTD
jgi:hypothetical protein